MTVMWVRAIDISQDCDLADFFSFVAFLDIFRTFAGGHRQKTTIAEEENNRPEMHSPVESTGDKCELSTGQRGVYIEGKECHLFVVVILKLGLHFLPGNRQTFLREESILSSYTCNRYIINLS